MAPLLLGAKSGKPPGISLDCYRSKPCISGLEQTKPFASVTMSKDKPFDFLR
ncbi:hypothetical protein T12_2204, partial [Trichinella patagoniensis]